jgi:hypothetical protein
MEGSEVLSAVAQVALGLAGFTGVVISLGREPGGLSRVKAYRLSVLLLQAGAALLLSLIPFGLFYLNIGYQDVWRISSALMALFTILFLSWLLPRSREMMQIAPEIFNHPVFFVTCLGHVVNIILQAMNALNVFNTPVLGLYLFGLFWLLWMSLQQFGRMVFIPQREPKRRKK